jgi:nucleoside-diphosphate-sugar epimerase
MVMTKSDLVLIAGGAGFIGTNLVRTLLDQGLRVHCVDNFSTGYLDAVAQFVGHERFELFRGDITDSDFISLFENNPYTAIYNLACPTGVPNIVPLGEAMLMTSSIGSMGLLRLARSSGAKYLFTSTAEIYGDPEVVPQFETYNGNVDPVGPRSPYEEGKRFAEAFTSHYAKKYGLDARIIRVFNTYGPNMSPHDTRVIPQLLSRMALKESVTIYGDGSNTRAFLHVDDLIRGFQLTMKRQQCGEVYNIGGDQEMQILKLFEVCKRISGYNKEPVFEPHFIEDHRRRLPGTERIRSLGWQPRINVDEGIRDSYSDMLLRLQERRTSHKTGWFHSTAEMGNHRQAI